MLNSRSVPFILKNMMRLNNYVAIVKMGYVYESPLTAASQYFLGRGDYPRAIRLRTPIGIQEVVLFNNQDAITVHEIFCREDYRCPTSPRVIVDLGSNIGVSALYFLTHSQSAFCELYEPNPDNVTKLLRNLGRFDGRFELHQRAVADREGIFSFTKESTGRYGSLAQESWIWTSPGTMATERISVEVEHINTVLDRTISRHGAIDLLKIDTEGSEPVTLAAIDPSFLKLIRYIVIECSDRIAPLKGFDSKIRSDTIFFANRNHRGDV